MQPEAMDHLKEILTNPEISNGSNSANGDGGSIGLLSSANDSINSLITAASYPKVMILNIGGRKFQTSPDTLRTGSGLFRLQLSERYRWEPEADGSYFMDADPDLFAHLLRFMRRPEIFPLFYTKANGFDYDLYNRLEVEAEYFQIDTLWNWLREKKYLEANEVRIGPPVVRNINHLSATIVEGFKNEEVHVKACTKKVYLCPRQIPVHRRHPEQCGVACHKRQAENAVVYEDEPYWQILSMKKEVLFDKK
jgi:hypothetical protein